MHANKTGSRHPGSTPQLYRASLLLNTGLGVGGGGDAPPPVLPVRNRAPEAAGSWVGMGVLTSIVSVFTNPQTEIMA